MPENSASDTCIMFLIRHGATDNNLSKPPILQGNGLNGPLSEIGKKQAELTSGFLAKWSLSALYSSPMLRARQTAEVIVSRQQALSIQETSKLVEVHVGDWEGLNWKQIEEANPEYYAQHMADPATVAYPNGESLQDVQQRCVPELLQIIQKHTGYIAVTAHNVVNRSMLSYLLGSPLKDVRKIRQDNCGVNILRRRGDKIELMSMNLTFHLNEI